MITYTGRKETSSDARRAEKQNLSAKTLWVTATNAGVTYIISEARPMTCAKASPGVGHSHDVWCTLGPATQRYSY